MTLQGFMPKKFRQAFLIVTLISLIAMSGSISIGALPARPISLVGPYVDWMQQEIPFGSHSYYHAPWRSYMDTWDASRLLDALGVVFNLDSKEADATAQLLSEAGIKSARVEIGWGSLDYEDDSRLRPHQEGEMRQVLQALRKHGIRPLILLNSNSGMPAPSKSWEVELLKPASKGDTELYLSDSRDIKPHYTGLRGIAQFMYPIITSINHQSGRATLSAPLPEPLGAGTLSIGKSKYRPFSGSHYEDGIVNQASQETVNGWMNYVRTVTSFVKETLQTDGAEDAGFDVEVWNELSFGSHFLNIDEYYDPPIKYGAEVSYRNGDQIESGAQVILPMTAAYVSNPASGLPGVRVINGFANQRPWDNGTKLWPGQTGFSRHYYTGYDPEVSQIGFDNPALKKDTMLDRLGQPDLEGYIPPHVSAFPERWFYAYQTEFVVRDLQPFPGPLKDHFRYSHPGDGKPPEVWMTESNLYRGLFAEELAVRAKINLSDPKMADIMHHIGAKSTLRHYIFQSHKGVQTINLYAVKGKDTEFALLPESYYEKLKRSGYRLTPAVRQAAGPQLQAIRNVVALIEKGEPIEQPRFVGVEHIQSFDTGTVYNGKGTPELPDRYQVEDLAVMPYQLKENVYAIAYYIVTRDITQSWNMDEDLLNPQRYTMPEQTYQVTLTNIYGKDAEVSAYDPINNSYLRTQVIDATDSTLTVQVPVTDTPRFLLIEEKGEQPLLSNPIITAGEEGTAVAFTPSISGNAIVTWGPYPFRNRGIFKETIYGDDHFYKRLVESTVDKIEYNEMAKGKVSYEWTGTIRPLHSERYSFMIDADTCRVNLWIDDKPLIDGCTNGTRGEIELKAGRNYSFKAAYSNPYDQNHHMSVYWASESQPRETVAPATTNDSQMIVNVTSDERVQLLIPDLQLNEGVKIELTSDAGITTKYPEWNYDIRGVLWHKEQVE